MQIYDYKEYDWNRCVGPAGNLGKVNPTTVAKLCDRYEIPWYTDGWPHASGLHAYCNDDELWHKIIQMSKESQ